MLVKRKPETIYITWCEACGKKLGKDESNGLWRGAVVCEECYAFFLAACCVKCGWSVESCTCQEGAPR